MRPGSSATAGSISSEWEFAKGLQVLEEAPEVYAAMDRFVEAADWIVWQLCGTYVRNACTAGYKGILQDGAYPSVDFLQHLNLEFGDFVRPSSPSRSASWPTAPVACPGSAPS